MANVGVTSLSLLIILFLEHFWIIFVGGAWIVPNLQDDISTKYTVCSVQLDRGQSCGPPVIRWYFDSVTQKCKSFEHGGCGGNWNNFPTQDFCNSYCNGIVAIKSGGDNFNEVLEDDPIANDTVGFRNNTSRFANFLNDSSAGLSATNISSQQVAKKVVSAAESVLNATLPVINDVGTAVKTINNPNAPTSSQLMNSGKEAYVNLITECQDDSSCPMGYLCQRNATTKRSYCLLLELGGNDFVTQDKFGSQPVLLPKATTSNESLQNLVNEAKNETRNVTLKQSTESLNVTQLTRQNSTRELTNMSIISYDAPIKDLDDMLGCNNDSCPTGHYCCSLDKVCCPLSNTVDIDSTVEKATEKLCKKDADCSVKASCVDFGNSTSVCVQDNQFNNVPMCPHNTLPRPMKKFDGRLQYCTQSKPCPEPQLCSPIEDKLGVCCGPS